MYALHLVSAQDVTLSFHAKQTTVCLVTEDGGTHQVILENVNHRIWQTEWCFVCGSGGGRVCVHTCSHVCSCMFCRFFFLAHRVMWQVIWLGSNHLKRVTHLLAGSFPKRLSNDMFITMLCAKRKQHKKWQVSISSFFFKKNHNQQNKKANQRLG